jgi:hypothetical protein
MAFKMKGWSAFTKGDGPLYKKGIKDGKEETPLSKLGDPSLDALEGAATVTQNMIEGGPMTDDVMVGPPPYASDEGLDMLKDRVEAGPNIRDIDVVDVLADDDAEMEEAEDVTPELKEPIEADKKDVAAEAGEAAAAAAGAVVGGGAAKGAFPEFTGEVKDKGRWRQRRQRRKELRDAGMSRKEARIQAREDIGKKWGKHKA